MRSSSGSASSRGPVQDISDAEVEAVFADLLRPPDTPVSQGQSSHDDPFEQVVRSEGFALLEPSAPPVQPPPSPGVDQSVGDFWDQLWEAELREPQPEEEPAAVQLFVRPDFVPAHWPNTVQQPGVSNEHLRRYYTVWRAGKGDTITIFKGIHFTTWSEVAEWLPRGNLFGSGVKLKKADSIEGAIDIWKQHCGDEIPWCYG